MSLIFTVAVLKYDRREYPFLEGSQFPGQREILESVMQTVQTNIELDDRSISI